MNTVPKFLLSVTSLAFMLSAVLLLVFITTVDAQTTVGQISGTITDASGAIVPGTSVTVTDEATQLTRAVTSDENGFYVVTNLPVGNYRVSVERTGFKKTIKTGYNLVADGRITVDFALELGEVTETVVVTENIGETVNTSSGEVARVVDGQQVRDLALNGRNYLQLTTLIPGSLLLEFDPIAQITNPSSTQAINGNRSVSNNLTVDGGFNKAKYDNAEQLHNVGIDFIQEVKIQTSNFSAEYGRQSGASINVVTRSGGNRFTGSAFEYLRNEVLDARSYFAPRRNRLRFNDFGYSFGGPILKDKFFFFGGQEWKYVRQDTAALRRTLPTRAQRRGDFSGTPGALNLPGTTTPIPGRNISALITPEGSALARVYDAAERSTASYVDTPTGNNAVFQLPSPYNFRQDILRLDYRFNDKHRIYGRYLFDTNNLNNPFGSNSQLPTGATARLRDSRSVLASYTWLISTTLVNEAIFNFSKSSLGMLPLGDSWRREVYGLNFPQLFNDGPYPDGLPNVNIVGLANFRGPAALTTDLPEDTTISDNLTIIRGQHTLKIGGLLIHNSNPHTGVGTSIYLGLIDFNPAGNTNSTGNAFADALLGNFRTYSESQSPRDTIFRSGNFEAYLSDNWKATRKLSFELGLRYQYIRPQYTDADNLTTFDPQLYNSAQAVIVNRNGTIAPGFGNRFNGLVRAGSGTPRDDDTDNVRTVPAGAPRALYEPDHLFGPRVSFAFAPFDNNKTALRGGFGIFFDSVQGTISQQAAQNPPFVSQTQFENGNTANPSSGRGAALAPLGAINVIDPTLKTPYTMNFSLSVQRELPRGFFVESAYVGNLGRHLLRRPDINQSPFEALASNALLPADQRATVNALRPYRGYSQINMALSDSTSNYHALQLYAAKRTGDLRVTGSYTFSKALTDSNSALDNPEDPFNRRFNYGPASFDRRHVFVSTYTYAVPFFRDSQGFVKALLSGYEVSGITRLQTGQFFTVISETSIGQRRADYITGQVNLPCGEQSVNMWFNTAAFAPAPNTQRGTSGAGIVRGPGLQLWDISLRRRFGITEAVGLLFQADFFNAFNRANFLALSVNASNPDFGSVTSAAPGRNIQFGIKLSF